MPRPCIRVIRAAAEAHAHKAGLVVIAVTRIAIALARRPIGVPVAAGGVPPIGRVGAVVPPGGGGPGAYAGAEFRAASRTKAFMDPFGRGR